MGRYIDWADVVDRYPQVATLGGADEISSTYIAYGEAYVDGALAAKFTPPFSNNNMTVKDLCIDYCYWRAARYSFEDAADVNSSMHTTIMALKSGAISMVDDGGNVVSLGASLPSVYSNTASYHSAFGMGDPLDYKISEQQLCDEEDARD